MTGIKPTVSLFRVWQRELDGVLAHFSTTYTLYYCGYALTLPWSSCYSCHVTHCDCDLWRDHLWPSVTPLWYCDKVTWYFPALHLVVVNKKRKEKKRNINNDLANLPSHDKVILHNNMFLSLNFGFIAWAASGEVREKSLFIFSNRYMAYGYTCEAST